MYGIVVNSLRFASIVMGGCVALGAITGCAKKEEAPPVPTTAAGLAAPTAAREPGAPAKATARVLGRAGTTVAGTVTFEQVGEGVKVTVEVSGVEPGPHGFHVHEIADCSAPDFGSAGGHFNPSGAKHGGPKDPEHHAGDLGNLEVGEDGTGRLELAAAGLTVTAGPNSVVNRSIVLHEKADDLMSQPAGEAGGRVGCGAIALGNGGTRTGAAGPSP